MTPWIMIDFETASDCDLKVCGAWRYAEDVTTDVTVLCAQTERGSKCRWTPGQPIPEMIRYAIEHGYTFIAHNADFEKAMWKYHMVALYGWPPIPPEQWHDTMAVCALRGVPLSLEKSLEAMHLTEAKDLEGSKLNLTLSRVNKKTGMYPERTPALMERIYEYCESDVPNQVALHNRLGWLPDYERPVWLLNQTINERGLRLDMDYVRAAKQVVAQASGPLATEFQGLTGGLNFGQTAKVKAWAADRGVIMPDMTKETIAKMIGDPEDDDPDFFDHPILPPDVSRALEIKQLIGSSSLKKLDRMEKVVGMDGRARGMLQYHGTGPGRQTGRLFQPHNFPRGLLRVDGNAPDPQALVDAILTGDAGYVEALFGEPVQAVVSGLRHAIMAEEDHVFVSGDYSGIQARVVLALAGQHDKTALMASGVDVYCDMASTIYKREITKHDKEERQIGKNSVLGLGFQMGAMKFWMKYAPHMPFEFIQEVVDTYRKVWAPLVPKVWYTLQEASLKALVDNVPVETIAGITYRREDAWLTARLPGGNKLWYREPELIWKQMPWSTDEEPDIRQSWRFKATKNKKVVTVDAFGGLLTENAVMGIERQIVVDAMFRCEAENYPVVLDVHDEVLTEPWYKHADPKVLKAILEDVKPWVHELKVPIQVDEWIGPRYKK